MYANRPLILVVEDDLPIQRFLRTSLGDHGFEIVV
jgi:DNA-binding response OmpR family regulator